MLSKSSGESGVEDPYIVASASSDGVIRVWDVRRADEGKPLSEVNTRSRLTCLAGSSVRSKSAFCLLVLPYSGGKSASSFLSFSISEMAW